MTDGSTLASGNAQVQLPLEADQINATANGYWGESSITYNAKVPDPVTIILGNEAEVITNERLIVEEAKHGLVSRSAASLSLQFTDGLNNLLRLNSVSNVLISNDSDNFSLDVSDKFNLSNGKIVCTDVAGLMQAFGGAGDRMTITVAADTAIDEVSGVAKIYIGEHTLKGRLVRPASNTALNLANLVVLAKVNKSDLVLLSATDADGYFAFPDLPQEQVSLAIETLQGGLYYYGDASVSMKRDVDVAIKLGTVNDIIQAHLPLSGRPR